MLSLGGRIDHDMLQKRMDTVKPNYCCSIIYTVSTVDIMVLVVNCCVVVFNMQSGTSGKPKGVLLSHDNVRTFIT